MFEVPNIENIKLFINATKHVNIDIKGIILKTMDFCSVTDKYYVLDSISNPLSYRFE